MTKIENVNPAAMNKRNTGWVERLFQKIFIGEIHETVDLRLSFRRRNELDRESGKIVIPTIEDGRYSVFIGSSYEKGDVRLVYNGNQFLRLNIISIAIASLGILYKGEATTCDQAYPVSPLQFYQEHR